MDSNVAATRMRWCAANERRAIVSIDMRDMHSILLVHKEDIIIRVESGITGFASHQRLRNKGLAVDHEPVSWELSSLGFCAATRASVTQLYEMGVAVYVYYGVRYGVPNALTLFNEIEKAAVQAITANSGSLSHHHGVVKHRREWLPDAISGQGVSAIQGNKTVLGPTTLFAAGNILSSPNDK